MTKPTIIIIEDAMMLAKTYSTLFPSIGYEVIQAVDNFKDAKRALAQHQPTLATLDLRIRIAPGELPQSMTAGEMRSLRNASPSTRFCALTEAEECQAIDAALSAGIAGYLTKAASLEEISACFSALREGRPYYQASLATTIVPEVYARRAINSAGDRSPFDVLTEQQRRVCADILDGLQPCQIASRRNLTESTVSRYRQRIRAVVGVQNDIQLLRAALRHGFIATSEWDRTSL
jgi:DNA-binding NarL/FixJ family response regulator